MVFWCQNEGFIVSALGSNASPAPPTGILNAEIVDVTIVSPTFLLEAAHLLDQKRKEKKRKEKKGDETNQEEGVWEGELSDEFGWIGGVWISSCERVIEEVRAEKGKVW